MKIGKALEAARRRVRIVPYNNGNCVVQIWSPKHNATWASHQMIPSYARQYAKEARIREALVAKEIEDADSVAGMLADREGRWDALVREYVAGQRQ